MVSAFRAYAESRKKEIKIKKTMQGIEFTAKNFSVQELKDMKAVDLIKFEPLTEETPPPETPPYTETDIGFKPEK